MQAIAKGLGLSISTKDSIEICNKIRGRTTVSAKALLERVIAMEEPIRYTRFTNGLGHRKGDGGTGRWPLGACKALLKIVKTAEANAQVKGLDVGKLFIASIIPNRGSRSPHHGRKRGIQNKSTHIEITVEEKKE